MLNLQKNFDKKKVSVIIPTYNSPADLLNRSIESVLNQSIGIENIEIIVIDDQSTNEDTISTLKKWERKIQLKICETNSGTASVPRNLGLSLAQGEYVFFLDSDDYLKPDSLSKLFKFAQKNNSDLVIGKYGVEGKGRGVPKAPFENGNVDHAHIIDDYLIYTLHVEKLFKREIIENYHIRFKENARTAEDQLFVLTFMTKTSNYSILADQEYSVLVNRFDDKKHKHLSKTESNPKDYFDIIGDIYRVIYQSPVYDEQMKDMIAAKYTTRQFRHGPHRKISISKSEYSQKLEWLSAFSNTLNREMPRRADKYVTELFFLKLEALRSNNLFNIMVADKLLEK